MCLVTGTGPEFRTLIKRCFWCRASVLEESLRSPSLPKSNQSQNLSQECSAQKPIYTYELFSTLILFSFFHLISHCPFLFGKLSSCWYCISHATPNATNRMPLPYANRSPLWRLAALYRSHAPGHFFTAASFQVHSWIGVLHSLPKSSW